MKGIRLFLYGMFALFLLGASQVMAARGVFQVNGTFNDVEENTTNGGIDAYSSDLELVDESWPATNPPNQQVGVRFTDVSIPPGAVIIKAYIQFTCDNINVNKDPFNVQIWGEDTDNSAIFTTNAYNVSTRTKTGVAASWSGIPFWNTIGEAGPDQRTPDLSAVIQQIVNRCGWSTGNAMSFIFTGIGRREAESYNGDADAAPVLVVDYAAPSVFEVMSSTDDAEQNASTGGMYMDSSDLEIPVDGSYTQFVGIRFAEVSIPRHSKIVNAYVQFTADSNPKNIDPFNVTIAGEDADTSAAYSTNNFDLSSRTRTFFTVAWNSAGTWTGGDSGVNQRTPVLTDIIQEIVMREGWSSKNAISLFFWGTGTRNVESFDGITEDAPKLVVAFLPPASTAIAAGDDDVEENVADGAMYMDSSDLELVDDGANSQVVGCRFINTGIPRHATIYQAYVQFTVDDATHNVDLFNVTIRGEAADHAAPLTSTISNVSMRSTTSSSVAWGGIPHWLTNNVAGPNQRTPDLKNIIQEIVNREGWSETNALLITFSGEGRREADSYEGGADKAPVLNVVHSASGGQKSTRRYRLCWNDDPATTMGIGWEQVRGSDPVVLYDTVDHGTDWTKYAMTNTPHRHIMYREMDTYFSKLTGLPPNTNVYFVVKDSEDVSNRMWFRTAPDGPDHFTFISGGDSRTNPEGRKWGNSLLSKIRPLFIVHGGDYMDVGTSAEWADWLDEWQLTMSADGRVYPVIPVHGNHENMDRQMVYNVFDSADTNGFYAIDIAGNMMRLYILNSELEPGVGYSAFEDQDYQLWNKQAEWFRNDIAISTNNDATWVSVSYHRPFRPHQSGKVEGDGRMAAWADAMYANNVKIAFESDSHCVKRTYPIIQDNTSAGYEGFRRDDNNGIVYIGEGSFGAPTRAADDNKPWTMDSASFWQYKLIHVSPTNMDIRCVKFGNKPSGGELVAYDPDTVTALTQAEQDANSFAMPTGLDLWNPIGGEVLRLPYVPNGPNPTAPSNLIAASITNEAITLQWADNSTNEVKFILHMMTGLGNEWAQQNISIPSNSTTYTMINLIPDMVYGFRIAAVGHNGVSDFSNEILVKTLPKTTPVILSQNFDSGSFGDWVWFDLSGPMNHWAIETRSGVTYAFMNGYAGGADLPSDDWLVSPTINLDESINETFSFRSCRGYYDAGPNIFAPFISTDYNPDIHSDPGQASWTELPASMSPGDWVWAPSGDIDLSGYSGTNIHLAVRYTSSGSAGNSSAKWQIDDLLLLGEQANPPALQVDFATSPENAQFTGPTYVEFTTALTGGRPPFTFQWNFGDGSNSTLMNPFHQYQNAGVYQITVTVMDSDSVQRSATNTVTLYTPINYTIETSPANGMRIATFNCYLNRTQQGKIIADLFDGTDTQAAAVAEIIQRVRPDVILLNEFDHDNTGMGVKLFKQNYLAVSQNGSTPIDYPHHFIGGQNTGVNTGKDLDNNGSVVTNIGAYGYGNDCHGYGEFPGQYGMAILSRYPIVSNDVRTFQMFLWKDMPNAMWPTNADGSQWYAQDEKDILRLSSKSHWDVPVNVNGAVVHVLASHPTPPVFDGAEDRNGVRNYDEIRFWRDYITPGASDYIYDDNSVSGGLGENKRFVIMGDQNADPIDGDSVLGAIDQLLKNPYIDESLIPRSPGGLERGADSGQVGAPAYHTGNWASNPLRIDYVLPSDYGFMTYRGEVFWPGSTNDLVYLVGHGTEVVSSDHRMVWKDLILHDYFPQSVASGDPTADSVVLWTRVYDPALTNQDLNVTLQVATDMEFTNMFTTMSRLARKDYDFCVKARVTGMQAGTRYYYRFLYTPVGGDTVMSKVGRTQTARATGDNSTIRFAFFSCQDYIGRFYNTFEHLLTVHGDDLDFMVHVGDYIYETTGDPGFQSTSGVRRLMFRDTANAITLSNSQGQVYYAPYTVGNYRDVYRTYRSDPVNKRIHEAYPYIVVWDDHEYSDDCWGDTATYFDGKQNETDGTRRRNAEQAFFEYVPINSQYDANGIMIDTNQIYPNGQIYRNFRFGDNLGLFMSDYRSYRPDHLVPEDSFPGTIVMDTNAVIAVLGSAGYTAMKNSLDPYVNIDDPEHAIRRSALTNIITGLYMLEGLDAVSAKARANAAVEGNLSANYLNAIFATTQPSLMISSNDMLNLPVGLSYLYIGKQGLFSANGSRYLCMRDSYELYAAYRNAMTLGASEDALGATQQAWLTNGIATCTANWKILASSVSFTPMMFDFLNPTIAQMLPPDMPAVYRNRISLNVDQWDGFPNRRKSLLNFLRSQNNTAIISGDIHASFITDHQGVPEFTGVAISSATFQDMIENNVLSNPDLSGVTGISNLIAASSDILRMSTMDTNVTTSLNTANYLKQHGYVVIEAGASQLQAHYYHLASAYVSTCYYGNVQFLTSMVTKTTFTSTDLDADGLADDWEILYYGSIAVVNGSSDTDSDGLNSTTEQNLGANPTMADTDGDSVNDGDEYYAGTQTTNLMSAPFLYSRLRTRIVGAYTNNIGTEIVAHDPTLQRLYGINAAQTIEAIDISNPAMPVKQFDIDLSAYGSPNSVAFKNGNIAVALAADPHTDPGLVAFLNGTQVVKTVTVGANPDMVTFTPDGNKVLVANEGEPNEDYSIDPDGSVSIIDISQGVANATVKTATFTHWNPMADTLRSYGVRIFTNINQTVAQDLEPEYITVSTNSATAWVTLQENNAIGVVDVNAASVTSIIALGYKEHSEKINRLDATDKDEKIFLWDWPVWGMYQPDSIAGFVDGNGSFYAVIANEGDARDYDAYSEETRVKNVTLDPTKFLYRDEFQKSDQLGRLKMSTLHGDVDGDGDFDWIASFGGRSFSILDANGNMIYDSGHDIAHYTAMLTPRLFNSKGTPDSFDERSDDKGAEPEGAAVGVFNGRTYAFIGLERTSGTLIYDITDPYRPMCIQYAFKAGDIAPEGISFISVADSPTNGMPLLVVANEDSDSDSAITLYGLYEDTTDQDGDNIEDWYEIGHFGNLTTIDDTTDHDQDGLNDHDEFLNRTNPNSRDTDGDQVSDNLEVLAGTDPLNPLSHTTIPGWQILLLDNH